MKLEPWMHRAYQVLAAAGKTKYYLLLSEDEVVALSCSVVLARTAVQAHQALESLEEMCGRHRHTREEQAHVEATAAVPPRRRKARC